MYTTMYTTMHAFHCTLNFKEKHCTLNVYITEFFLKLGGGQIHYCPPPKFEFREAMAPPPGPPIADPMHKSTFTIMNEY